MNKDNMIGKNLYHYLSMRGVGKYEVIGVDGEFLLLKCLACNNQEHACIVKVNKEDGYEGRWKYVSMFQSCGEDSYENLDGEEVSTEYMWHNDSPFFEKYSNCKKHEGKKIIDNHKSELKKLEKQIEYKKNKIKELDAWMNIEEVHKH